LISTKEANSRPSKTRFGGKRFTDPAFIENLWKLFAEHLNAQIKVDSEWPYHGLDERQLAAALIRVCTWAKLRPIFEKLVWLKVALPEIS
jgi:hypothetical protein